jgi:hypothetical protein
MSAPVCFVVTGELRWASTRFRATWPAAYIPGSIVVQKTPKDGGDLPDADNYVWIKYADPVELDRHPRSRHFLDSCDPTWWWNPSLRNVIDRMDGLVCSCQALADDLAGWSGHDVICIPDRIEMDEYPIKASQQHSDPVRFIWFGASQNRISLFGALTTLERLAANGVNVNLTIFDDQPREQWNVTAQYPWYYVNWTTDTENQVLAAHDIALLPPYPGPWGQVKSNNKSLTAWANGLAVCDGQDYNRAYELATKSEARRADVAFGRAKLGFGFYAEESGKQWREVLNV